jgi:hypothetical protein
MPTTVLSLSLTADDSGDEGESMRNTTSTSPLLSASLGQVRVRFVASAAAGNFTADHASIGIDLGDSTGSTTATPVELLFSGAHGFNISQGTTITSDWANLNFLITDKLMIIFDLNAASGGAMRRGTVANVFIKPAVATYNVATVTGFAESGFTLGYDLIETQSGGADAVDSLGNTIFRRRNQPWAW